MKQPTLDEFIAAYGTRKYMPNLYVREKGFTHFYVRMSPRIFREGPRNPTLDLANIEARYPGNGTFKRLVARLRQQYPHMTLFVEAVMIQRFREGLLRMGFKQIGADCFVIFGEKENVDITNPTGV